MNAAEIYHGLRPGGALRAELDAAYRRVMDSGRYVLGPEVEGFEREYAAYCGSPHAVGVGSGLEALHLSLRVLGIGPGDEVVVPSNTYIATWLGVSQCGATPVPAEPDPATLNIDPQHAADAITPRTRAVLAVNLYGLPCAYDALAEICRAAAIPFLVDNAQAQGARYRGRTAGGIADLECHSFYPSKNLGAYGEGGAVTTWREDWADSLRLLRNYGARSRYEHELQGFNARLDELQAAFLRVKLRHLDSMNAQRAILAGKYSKDLEEVPTLRLPATPPDCSPVWHQFVVRHPERDRLVAWLADRDVPLLVHYPTPPHLSDAYRRLGLAQGCLPVAERLAREVVSLPTGTSLGIDAVDRLVSLLREFE